ncbi:hypothetical protein ['Chrysanthemum coronarium' phytoplasma]|nr:hypothetical protein ['Chrysanthemum coronarium' phytoplasma]
MKQEKEELEDLIEYFQDDDFNMVNFDKLIPKFFYTLSQLIIFIITYNLKPITPINNL